MASAVEGPEPEDDGAAGDDPPAGRSEASWWPLVAAAGALFFYAGAGLYLVGHGAKPVVPGYVGPVVFAAGFCGLLVGTGGWFYTGFVRGYWGSVSESVGTETHRLGMVLFVVSDLATFSAGFVYYVFVRVDTWPPGHLPNLLSSLLLVNTVALLASSATLELAHRALRRDDRRRFVGYLGATVLLGAAFLAGQAKEYHDSIVEEGFTLTSGVFGSAFYGLTGLHGAHVAFGVVLLLTLLVRGYVGQFSVERDTAVETISMYWHTVDAVWLVIITTVYLGATFAQ